MENYFLENDFFKKLVILFVLIFSLSGCSNFRKAIGSEKLELDEFSTVTQKRLVIPKDFDLSKKIVSDDINLSQSQTEMLNYFGVKSRKEIDKHDMDFSKNFPLYEISSNIRTIIDEETLELQKNSMAGIDMLFNDGSLPLIGEVINPEKEQKKFEYLKGN